jgi:hypothetical protein
MADTTFIDGITPVPASWLNDVNTTTYKSFVNVKSYGAKGDGVTDDTAAIQEALNIGGNIYIPEGVYKFSRLNIHKYTTIFGAGIGITKLITATTFDGLNSTWPINSSTAVFISLSDITIENTNSLCSGGGFVDVGGTFLHIHKVQIIGFKHSVILDQSELVDIELCDFESPISSWMWLTNDGSHTPGALSNFTNRVTVRACQFNGVTGAILDDGGYAHAYLYNNFNGGGNHIRAAAVNGLTITGGEYESASSTNILISSTTWQGISVGPCIGIDIGGGAQIIPTTGNSCVNFQGSGHSGVSLGQITFGASSAVKIIGTSNIGVLVASGPIQNSGGGNTFDGSATYHTEFGLNGKISIPTTNWTPIDGSGAGLILVTANAKYYTVGNRIIGEAIITYPITANGAAASLSGFPITAASGGIHCNITYTDVATTNLMYLSGGSGNSASFYTPGANVTNATLSGKTIKFTFEYFV